MTKHCHLQVVNRRGINGGVDPTDGISQMSQSSRRGELTPSANKGGQVSRPQMVTALAAADV